MKEPLLIFDYDGTIHETARIYEPAFREVCEELARTGRAPRLSLSSEQIKSLLGMNSKETWDSLFPKLPDSVKHFASQAVGDKMAEQIRARKARWYPDAQATLDLLKKRGYSMLILSNCRIQYKEINQREFSMARWFLDFYDCETYGFAPKTEIIRQIKKKYPLPYVVIGDRASDLDCARVFGDYAVGAAYGYGSREELQGADVIIKSLSELPAVLQDAL